MESKENNVLPLGSIVILNGDATPYAAMAQSVERVLGKDEVTSSNLVSSSRNHSK